ncbi:hypothetical protein HY732_04480 [Candidatus Uhrbacteria bacterium]|nr:hypothetical protein [Candidatus Uhrbacteria bacterium]
MNEKSLRIEKRSIIPLMAVAVECLGAPAYAQPPLSEEYNRQEVYGEAYKLFEQAIDRTTDKEILSISKGVDPKQARQQIKYVLPLLWSGYGRDANERIGNTTFARANYDILSRGAKIFFEKMDAQQGNNDYTLAEHEENCSRIVEDIERATDIPAERVLEKKDANCVIHFYFSEATAGFGFADQPISSFPASTIGYMRIPVYSSASLKEYFRSLIVKTAGLIRFTRSYLLFSKALHEFGHVLGLGHADAEGMREYKPDFLDAMAPGAGSKLFFYEGSDKGANIYYDSEQNKTFEIISNRKLAEKSDSFTLIRWLRLEAVKGELKGLLEKAEKLKTKFWK